MPKLQEQDSSAWWDVMGVMQKLLRKAADAALDAGKISPEQHHNYFMSGKFFLLDSVNVCSDFRYSAQARNKGTVKSQE